MSFPLDKPDWTTDGRDWPLRDWSRFVEAGAIRWHVQEGGEGPVCLLVHGTGAATHSWRGLAPLLAQDFRVVAPDLPGHGFTNTPPHRRLSLDAMARHLAALVEKLGARPVLAVGHSAGAAILVRMAFGGMIDPVGIVSINGALRPYRGAAGPLFSAMAKALFVNPLAPRVFAWTAGRPGRIERLIANTGSHLDARWIGLYRRLFRRPAHVAGALGMMANWDLGDLQRDLPRLRATLLLVATNGDRAVPPTAAEAVARRVPGSTVERVARLGHLAHEEDPQAFADIVRCFRPPTERARAGIEPASSLQ